MNPNGKGGKGRNFLGYMFIRLSTSINPNETGANDIIPWVIYITIYNLYFTHIYKDNVDGVALNRKWCRRKTRGEPGGKNPPFQVSGGTQDSYHLV